MKYILWLNDCESKPYDWSEIRTMIEDESLSPDAFARQENCEAWVNVMTIWAEKLGEKMNDWSAELDVKTESRESKYHIPYCTRCQKHVEPQVVNRTHTSSGIGLVIPTQIGYMVSQPTTTTNELIKLCPHCGEQVMSEMDVDTALTRIRKEKAKYKMTHIIVWSIISVTVLIAIIMILGHVYLN